MTSKPSKIGVVVVESHQHVLEHIHHVLRKKMLLNEIWSMLHFDAHPDLACPHADIPAAACFQPRKCWSKQDKVKEEQDAEGKDLYELLDSTSTGIAEWILPLVVAANLKTVHWIHPPKLNVQQLPDGDHQYHVGAWIKGGADKMQIQSFLDLPSSAVVKVDWDTPYYTDDDTYAPLSELLLPKQLALRVSNLSAGESSLSKEDGLWGLDICLDYFICRNPFLTDIDKIDPLFSKSLTETVLQSTIYDKDHQVRCDRHELQSFRQHLTELLQSINDDVPLDSLRVRLGSLFPYYSSNDKARAILEAMVKSLQNNATPSRSQLIALAIEALPNLTMPHNTEDITIDMIRPLIEQVCKAAAEFFTKEPFVITIARSSGDGFTPSYIVEDLQASVLRSVHDLFCDCSHAPLTPEGQKETCRTELLFDYGQWEGSTMK